MKNKLIIILTTVLASMVLFGGYTYAQYYDRYEYEDEYRYNSGYDDDEYWLDNAAYHLDRFHGPVYYFYHPVADVYFVTLGNITFVVPAYSFSPYMHRRNFYRVPRSRFITLSCGRMDYYDNSMRFNFYFDFYNRYRWNTKYHHKLRNDYRHYYNNRHRNPSYSTNRRVITKKHYSRPHHDNRSYKGYDDHRRYDNHKKYSYKRDRHDSNRDNNRYGKSKSYSSRKGDKKKYDSHEHKRDRY